MARVKASHLTDEEPERSARRPEPAPWRTHHGSPLGGTWRGRGLPRVTGAGGVDSAPTHHLPSLQLVKTAELDPSRNYIAGFHPHGVLAAGAFLNLCTESTGFSSLFPGIRPHLMMLTLWFRAPFFRDYIMSGGEPARPGALGRVGLGEQIAVGVEAADSPPSGGGAPGGGGWNQGSTSAAPCGARGPTRRLARGGQTQGTAAGAGCGRCQEASVDVAGGHFQPWALLSPPLWSPSTDPPSSLSQGWSHQRRGVQITS